MRQIEINIDYIIFLIEKYHSGGGDREIMADINRAVNASSTLRSKKDLIEAFIRQLNPEATSVVDEWLAFVRRQKEEQLEAIIEEEKLHPEKTRAFIEDCFREGEVKATGTEVAEILPPVSLFSKDGRRKEIKNRVVGRLKKFFERFYDIGG